MSGNESATFLMVQSTLLLHTERGQAQVTLAEWLTLCDELLEKEVSLGQIRTSLARRREQIAGQVAA